MQCGACCPGSEAEGEVAAEVVPERVDVIGPDRLVDPQWREYAIACREGCETIGDADRWSGGSGRGDAEPPCGAGCPVDNRAGGCHVAIGVVDVCGGGDHLADVTGRTDVVKAVCAGGELPGNESVVATISSVAPVGEAVHREHPGCGREQSGNDSCV